MLRAVSELPRAEVRTSAGGRSVPGMGPGTPISAVQSQDWAAACTNVVSTRGLAHRATRRVSRAGVEGAVLAGCTRHGFTRPSAAEAQADRVNALLGLRHGAVMWIQAPHPRVIDPSVPKFLQ